MRDATVLGMTFKLHIDVDNDVFQPNPAPELARLLREIAVRLDTVQEVRAPREHTRTSFDRLDYTDQRGGWLGHYQTVLDSNGNDVGRYAVKPNND